MAKFRETLWFKKGGAPSPEQDGGIGELPLDDRYLDDGTVTADDTATYGLHTQATAPIPTIARTRTKRRVK